MFNTQAASSRYMMIMYVSMGDGLSVCLESSKYMLHMDVPGTWMSPIRSASPREPHCTLRIAIAPLCRITRRAFSLKVD
jgi:hypothetical protein